MARLGDRMARFGYRWIQDQPATETANVEFDRACLEDALRARLLEENWRLRHSEISSHGNQMISGPECRQTCRTLVPLS